MRKGTSSMCLHGLFLGIGSVLLIVKLLGLSTISWLTIVLISFAPTLFVAICLILVASLLLLADVKPKGKK